MRHCLRLGANNRKNVHFWWNPILLLETRKRHFVCMSGLPTSLLPCQSQFGGCGVVVVVWNNSHGHLIRNPSTTITWLPLLDFGEHTAKPKSQTMRISILRGGKYCRVSFYPSNEHRKRKAGAKKFRRAIEIVVFRRARRSYEIELQAGKLLCIHLCYFVIVVRSA